MLLIACKTRIVCAEIERARKAILRSYPAGHRAAGRKNEQERRIQGVKLVLQKNQQRASLGNLRR
jgi:hypothetical protein